MDMHLRKAIRVLLALGLAAGATAQAQHAPQAQVFVASNAAGANTLTVLSRGADQRLGVSQVIATGGRGTGTGNVFATNPLGSQDSIRVSADRRWVFVVNAGSNQVSMFRIEGSRLSLVDVVDSQGIFPVSLAERDGRLWVLNGGGQPNVSAFTIQASGKLTPVANSTRNVGRPAPLLGGRPNTTYTPSQIAFSPDRRIMLVVTKDADARGKIYGMQMQSNGLPLEVARVTDSVDGSPIGAAFGPGGIFHVTNAIANTVTSYRVNAAGSLGLVASLPAAGLTAPCWIVFTPSFAYVTATPSASIVGFSVGGDGQLSPLRRGGVTPVGSGANPTDVTVSRDGAFLATVDGARGTVVNYRVGSQGELSLVNTVTVAAPAQGLQGIASN